MMFGRVMLCEVVSPVALAWIPVDMELSLPYPVSYPVEAHIHCFGSFLFDGICANSLGSAVVRYHWSRWLRVLHLLQRGSNGARIFSIVE